MNNKTSQVAAFDSSNENKESAQKQQQSQSHGKELLEQPIVISNFDVLSGRSAETTHHHHGGNAVLRSLITESLPAYSSCQTIHDRAILINGIIDKMHHSGARFLRTNQVHGYWIVMKSNEIRNKVATLVRDAFRRSKKKHDTRLLSDFASSRQCTTVERTETQPINSMNTSEEQLQNYQQQNPLSWSPNVDDRINQFRLVPCQSTISLIDQNQSSLENVEYDFGRNYEPIEIDTPQRQYFSQQSFGRAEENQLYHHRDLLITDSLRSNQPVEASNQGDELCVYGQNLQSTMLWDDHSATSLFPNVKESFEKLTISNSNDVDDDETNFEHDEFDQIIEDTLGPITSEDLLLNYDYLQSIEEEKKKKTIVFYL